MDHGYTPATNAWEGFCAASPVRLFLPADHAEREQLGRHFHEAAHHLHGTDEVSHDAFDHCFRDELLQPLLAAAPLDATIDQRIAVLEALRHALGSTLHSTAALQLAELNHTIDTIRSGFLRERCTRLFADAEGYIVANGLNQSPYRDLMQQLPAEKEGFIRSLQSMASQQPQLEELLGRRDFWSGHTLATFLPDYFAQYYQALSLKIAAGEN